MRYVINILTYMYPFHTGQASPIQRSVPSSEIPHYYGTIERRLFMAGAIIMLVAALFHHDSLPVSGFVSLLGVVFFVIVAGLVSPRQRFSSVLNTVVAASAVVLFGYQAIVLRNVASAAYEEPLFWINTILALTFFFALYYSMKTMRWRFSKGPSNLTTNTRI